MKFGFIGYGNMDSAIVSGMHKIGIGKEEMLVFNRTYEKIKMETEMFIPCQELTDIFEQCNIIFLGIKPQQYQAFLVENQHLIKGQTIISMAAGISAKFMSNYLDNYIQIMPNTSVANLNGQTAIIKSGQKNEQLIFELFSKLGEAYLIEAKEIHEYVALCGSSPAYVYEIIDVFSKVFAESLPEISDKEKVFASVFKAACEQVIEGDLSAIELRNKVMSKGGVTEQAIFQLESDGIKQIADNAIKACITRSIEMECENNKSL